MSEDGCSRLFGTKVHREKASTAFPREYARSQTGGIWSVSGRIKIHGISSPQKTMYYTPLSFLRPRGIVGEFRLKFHMDIFLTSVIYKYRIKPFNYRRKYTRFSIDSLSIYTINNCKCKIYKMLC